MDAVNPLLPAGYDIAWSIAVALVAVLVIIALVSLARVAGPGLTGTQALVWTVVALVVPVLGPIAWFAVGRRVAVAQAGRV